MEIPRTGSSIFEETVTVTGHVWRRLPGLFACGTESVATYETNWPRFTVSAVRPLPKRSIDTPTRGLMSVKNYVDTCILCNYQAST